jgi:hypothetical protein
MANTAANPIRYCPFGTDTYLNSEGTGTSRGPRKCDERCPLYMPHGKCSFRVIAETLSTRFAERDG